MQLRIYDPTLNFVGICENQTSLVWTRKYYEPGEFSIALPLTDENVRYFQLGNIISFRGAIEGGVIEDITLRETYSERSMAVAGRFLSSYMDRRLIRPKISFTGLTEVAMRSLLDGAAEIPLVELGELQGYEETVTFQATYKNLLSYEIKLAKGVGFGFRFRPDFTEKKILFEVYKGLDRTRQQSDRAFVEFSDKFDNMNEAEARMNDQLYKNVGYVGGQGEGEARVYTQVGDDTLVGLERRETFIDARDIFKEEDMSDSDYLAKLKERGMQKLNECVLSSSIECGTIPVGNYKYRVDYDLGDIVTIAKTNWGFSESKRITEISEVYEHETATIVPTFGDALPESIDLEDN